MGLTILSSNGADISMLKDELDIIEIRIRMALFKLDT